jgi:hypothetical protein
MQYYVIPGDEYLSQLCLSNKYAMYSNLLATSLINYVYGNKYAMYSVARLYYRWYVKITAT